MENQKASRVVNQKEQNQNPSLKSIRQYWYIPAAIAFHVFAYNIHGAFPEKYQWKAFFIGQSATFLFLYIVIYQLTRDVSPILRLITAGWIGFASGDLVDETFFDNTLHFSFEYIMLTAFTAYILTKILGKDNRLLKWMFDEAKEPTPNEKAEKIKNYITSRTEEIKRLREAFEGNADGTWSWHIKDNIEEYDDKFRSELGFTKAEFPDIPESWQKHIFPEDLETALTNFDRHVKTKGKVPYRQKVRYKHKDGSTVEFICRGKVVKWEGDEPILMIGNHTKI